MLLQSIENSTGYSQSPEAGAQGLSIYPGHTTGIPAAAVVAPKPPTAGDVYAKIYDPADPTTQCEVLVESSVTLEDYEAVTPPEDMARLREYAEPLEGKKVVRINATAAGGGVAIMNAPWVNMMRGLGVDAHWHAMKPSPEAAQVTKGLFHNVLQDVADPDARLSEEDKAVYEDWIDENAELLNEPLRTADVIIIDDWQPSGLIPRIRGYDEETEDGTIHHLGLNPSATIIFRDHIHTEGELMGTPGTPQHTTWDYLWNHNRISEADVFVAHPRDEFVPPDVPGEKVVFMPATCDVLDDLNRDITDEERQAGLAFINEQLAQNGNQAPLDLDRPYIVLIARFDESKGMPQGMDAYARARQRMIDQGVSEADLPQFVLLGNGSADDPSGPVMLNEMMRLRSEQPADIQDDLKIVRVPHNDVAINTLLKGAKIALQPSTKEGFESRVTDAILQGVPVIGSDRGGIPLQIVEGKSGHVIDPYDTEAWAERIVGLMTDDEAYDAMRRSTRELAEAKNYAFTTVPNVVRWLWLSNPDNTGPDFHGGRRWVDDHIAVSELSPPKVLVGQ
jgi:glycosyltransferase involved in cell wall biosynthesis